MSYSEVHYGWQYALKSNPEELWPFVSNSDRFNRDIGLPTIEPLSQEGLRLRNGRRLMRLSFLGLPAEWEEQPFEWIRPVRLGVTRTYSKGPLIELRVLAELTPNEGGGSTLSYQFWVKPKTLFGCLLVRLQFGLLAGKKFERVFKQYDQQASSSTTLVPEVGQDLPAVFLNRISSAKARLIEEGGNSELVEQLIDLVRVGDNSRVARIRPYELADAWKQPRRELLTVCLLATRAGLLELQWDLLCPLCRGAKQTTTSLRELETKFHCETCRIDFTANLDRYVEVTFRPNAAVRAVDQQTYCVGSPQRTPHVVAQQLLPPKNMGTVTLPLEPGNYRLRALELSGDRLLRVSEDGSAEASLQIAEDDWRGDELNLATKSSLQLQNTTDEEQLIILERVGWSDQAATAAEVTALQVFRDLFSSEALRPGEQISVGTLTILFTDLRNSTKLYREIGDATAFGRVMNHFDVLKREIAAEDGALVKTIGDAVMAVFRSPAAALRAMIRAQQSLAEPPAGTMSLSLKAGIHTGPCIAVTLNDRLDYFGSTINIAARLEGLSCGADVIISDQVFQEAEVQELLRVTPGLQAHSFEMELKGFDEERFRLWRVQRETFASSAEASGHT